jgi:L-fuculose-phosphate aldolase
MEARLRATVRDLSHRLHALGFAANHEGNLTVRLGPGRILATPGAMGKGAVTAESLIVTDERGRVLGGRGKAFSELGLHLQVYADRPDVGAVVHAHPPTATGFAVAGIALERPLLAEAVVSLGPSIPLVPFAPPGPAAAAALRPYLAHSDAFVLASHGVLTLGADLEQAFLRLEQVEQLARVTLVAHQLGGPRELPASVLPDLLEARRKAFPHTASGPPAPAATASARPTPAASSLPAPAADLTRIITEEVSRLLDRR